MKLTSGFEITPAKGREKMHLEDAVLDDKDSRTPTIGHYVSLMARTYVTAGFKNELIAAAQDLLTWHYRITDPSPNAPWRHIVTGLIAAGIEATDFLSAEEIEKLRIETAIPEIHRQTPSAQTTPLASPTPSPSFPARP